MMKKIDWLYSLFLRVANGLQSPLLLAVRLYWGWQFWETGTGKLANMPKVIENFTNWGIPAPAFTAHFCAGLETVGGVLLILGLASRLIAFPLTINLIVAFITTERDALKTVFSDDPSSFFSAAPFTFLCASLVILAFGPGFFSLDTLIKWYRQKHQQTSAASG